MLQIGPNTSKSKRDRKAVRTFGNEFEKSSGVLTLDFYEDDPMGWTTLKYTKPQINAAGRVLAAESPSPSDYNGALEVLNNLRASHSFALNTFQMRLRTQAREVTKGAFVAQRLKRVSSIVLKLRRYPNMELARMQGIGGCRAIVDSEANVNKLLTAYSNGKLKHEQVKVTDYIKNPKESGYRSIHLIYKYHSDRNADHNGRLIEIQLRSQLQHAWATAVETVGTFLDQSLKSSLGSQDWLNFFKLMGSAFATMEKTPLVPGVTTDGELLLEQIREATKALQVQPILSAYGQALNIAGQDNVPANAHWFLLSLSPSGQHLTANDLVVYAYPKDKLNEANAYYLEIEKKQKAIPGAQAVLVAVDSLSALRRSYPNYFLDTQFFLSSLNKFIG
jgi:ppGpp synthetase/RelA/SpoT-type nucleotidyltranferase